MNYQDGRDAYRQDRDDDEADRAYYEQRVGRLKEMGFVDDIDDVREAPEPEEDEE